jgi:cytoskeleton protein RodZ
MTESAQTSVGQMLREAREAQGVTVEDVAVRLRLMHRQIEAMEADDFESLGQPVFARGFVRNYARMLGLAPEALLARMEGAPEEQAVVSQADEPLPRRAWLSSPWLIVLLLGVLLLLAMPVALYLWLNSGTEDSTGNPAPVVQSPHAPLAPAVPVMPATAPPASQAAPGKPAPPKAATPSVQAAAPVESKTAAGSSVLHLEFGAESWTEISEAGGRMLLRQLNPAGSSVDVRGQPPFDVVIGNAAQARMSYNGRPIDLNPFIDVTVARFTLEE